MAGASLFGSGELADGADESSGRACVGTIAAIGNAQFAPELYAFDGNEDDFASGDLIVGKT